MPAGRTTILRLPLPDEWEYFQAMLRRYTLSLPVEPEPPRLESDDDLMDALRLALSKLDTRRPMVLPKIVRLPDDQIRRGIFPTPEGPTWFIPEELQVDVVPPTADDFARNIYRLMWKPLPTTQGGPDA
jgi:hypothetical protein